MLSIADPNDDRSLLTPAELRGAAGLSASDTSQDASLKPLGAYVSAMITKACKVTPAGAIAPTLRLETVTETFLDSLDLSHRGRLSWRKSLVLARRPVVEIVSVTHCGSTLTADDYQVDAAAGILYRKRGGELYFDRGASWCWWSCGQTIVEYSAGYDDVPDDLKYAAIKFVQAERAQGSRDPLLKRLKIEGMSEREYWVNPEKTSVVPGEVMDILASGGYMNRRLVA